MNPDIKTYFDNITGSVERILASADGLDGKALNWHPVPGESSSLWVLSTHIMGNLNQGILSTLCGEPDQRDRDSEFAASGESAEELRARWSDLKGRIEAGMSRLTTDDLERDYTHPRRGPMNGWAVLLNTATHASEHAGHAELTRQLIDSTELGE
jgi:hypothetical protein